MGKWNYRVVKKEGYLGIHEAYYDDNGNLHSLSENPVSPSCEDSEELEAVLGLMIESIGKSIIDFQSLKELDKKS